MIDIEILTAVLKGLRYLDDDEEEKDTSIKNLDDSKHDRKEDVANS